MKAEIPSIWTFIAKENCDLTKVKDLRELFLSLKLKITFPVTLQCLVCSNKYTIRALDDFPNKSVICKCKECCFVTLIKAKSDGSQEIIL